MALIEKLTGIADAIREKNGETGAMTLDGMKVAIEALELGGNVRIATGTYTAASNQAVSAVAFEHGLGRIPDFVMIYENGVFNPGASVTTCVLLNEFAAVKPNGDLTRASHGIRAGVDCYYGSASASNTNITDQKINFYGILRRSDTSSLIAGNYYAGKTYRWIAGCIE